MAVVISGAAIATKASVTLFRSGDDNVPAIITNASATSIIYLIDVADLALGIWNVLVANPDGHTGCAG